MAMDRGALYSFIRQQRYGVISSISGQGGPQSALVGIAITPELEIIFDTVRSSRKYGNLSARPACSLVIGWAGEQTVQYEGVAHEAGGTERERCLGAYFEAWPQCRTHLAWSDIAYFVVKPTWIRFSDYEQTPAFIEEMRLDGGQAS